MKEIIFGNRYDFTIELEKNNGNYSFEISSIYKKENKKSIITNVNFVISELISRVLHTADVETTILVSKNKGMRLFRKSLDAFKDELWVHYLESELDEDRNIGGWNSNFSFYS